MKSRRLVGVVATVGVVVLVVAGLFAAGSPATARKFRIDRDRKERLSQLHFVLASHARKTGSLPSSLGQLRPEDPTAEFSVRFDPRKDPGTGKLFEYRRLSAREYEICATFLTSSADRRDEGYYGGEREFTHKVGRNCYERRLTDDELRSDFYPQPGTIIRPVPVDSPSPRLESPPVTPSPTPSP